jgi:hypothetical protein
MNVRHDSDSANGNASSPEAAAFKLLLLPAQNPEIPDENIWHAKS